MSRATPHLTEAMREAAYAYAERLKKKGMPSGDAWEEARSLAARNLLTADGHKKGRGKTKAAKGGDFRVSAAERDAFAERDPAAANLRLGRDAKGYYGYRGKIRTDSYPTVKAIPIRSIRLLGAE